MTNNKDCNSVYVYDNYDAKYPTEKPYHPSSLFLEYPFDQTALSNTKNEVYDMIRDLFNLMKLDNENCGTSNWNPLRSIIKPGDKVLLKPNMVLHELQKGQQDILTTHGSIIRAVVDYVFIALNGKGSIIIADAPVQSCDFEKVVENLGLMEIVKFYKKNKNFEIKVIDFRQEQISKTEQIYIKLEKKLVGDPLGYTAIDLKERSSFKNVEANKEFIITNYNPRIVSEHHNEKTHQYLIPNTVLDADVIFNLPKPKTHRKAGMTACLKNMVGISGNKAWLPHHSFGSKSENGDEYLNKNIFKRVSSRLIIKRDLAAKKNHLLIAKFYNFLREINSRIFEKFKKSDSYSEGSWWGNDTIWRTIHDLNKIVIFADKEGKLHNKPQRIIISLADMIVSGEKEGPLHPFPKNVGMLIASFNSLAMDTVIATIMGFDYKKIPSISNGFGEIDFPFRIYSPKNIKIISNNLKNSKSIDNFTYKESFKFIPSDGWKNHIEIDNRTERQK